MSNLVDAVITQCNVSNSLSAKTYEALGERIILAREFSSEKIKEIKKRK